MNKALLVLASIAAIAFAGCAASSSPWATPDSVASAPVSQETDSASAAFEDPYQVTPGIDASVETQASGDLLADFSVIRQANLEKALKAIRNAAEVDVLPMPEKGNARITRCNTQYGVVEFLTPNSFNVGDKVVLTKEGQAALVTVIAVSGNRIVADLNAGVKGAPSLNATDHVLCDIYRTTEELEKIAAAQRKAQREALAAARAAAQQERALLAESEGGEDVASDDSATEEESEEDSSGSEEDFGDDEEW